MYRITKENIWHAAVGLIAFSVIFVAISTIFVTHYPNPEKLAGVLAILGFGFIVSAFVLGFLFALYFPKWKSFDSLLMGPIYIAIFLLLISSRLIFLGSFDYGSFFYLVAPATICIGASLSLFAWFGTIAVSRRGDARP